MTETDADHDHLISSVRNAVEQLSDGSSDGEHPVTTGSSDSDEAAEVGEQIAAQINADEQQRGQPSGQRRDGRGRFARSDELLASAPAEPAASPPTSWSIEAKAAFNDLPQPVRDAIAKREGEVGRGFSDYGERVRNYEAIENALAPHREHFAQHGFPSDAEAISHLLTFSQGFAQNPIGTLQFLCQQAGGSREREWIGGRHIKCCSGKEILRRDFNASA
jgi:hypothetical protein